MPGAVCELLDTQPGQRALQLPMVSLGAKTMLAKLPSPLVSEGRKNGNLVHDLHLDHLSITQN